MNFLNFNKVIYLPVLITTIFFAGFCFADENKAAPTKAPEPAPAKKITLISAGDVTLGYHFEEHLLKTPTKGEISEDVKKYPWKNIGEVMKAADITLVNLECPFTTAQKKTAKNFAFKATPKLVDVLPEGGVDTVTLANNHMMDYRGEGLAETIKTLERKKIAYFGAGKDLSVARQPAIMEVKGKKIGFLGYLHLGGHSIEPEVIWAKENAPGMAGHASDTNKLAEYVKEDIAKLTKITDIQIVVFHWGRETTHYPLDYQKKLAKVAVDSGADAVIAHHPHVLQGIEVYKDAPVFYSLGNFIFGGHWNPKNKNSLIIRLTFNEKSCVEKIELYPVLTDEVPKYPFRPRFAKGRSYDKIKNRMLKYSKAFGKNSVFESGISVEWKGEKN